MYREKWMKLNLWKNEKTNDEKLMKKVYSL